MFLSMGTRVLLQSAFISRLVYNSLPAAVDLSEVSYQPWASAADVVTASTAREWRLHPNVLG